MDGSWWRRRFDGRRVKVKEIDLFGKIGTVAVIGALLALAACGGGDDESPNETQEPDGGNGNGSEEVGREEFGMTEEELVTAIEDTEAAIAECMEAAGFEFVPIDPVTFRDAMGSLTAVPGLNEEEFVQEYGYGFTTLPPTERFRAGPENQTVYEALSPEDQVAYDRTLWGENTEFTFVYMLENEDFEGAGGCTEEAITEVFSEEQRDPNFENPFDVLVEEDPRYQDAVETWSDCMGEQGYDYESPEDAEDQILDQYEELILGKDPTTLEGSDKAALESLQAEEKAIAVADLACAEEHLIPVEEQVERDISGRN
jgi:hypothetical protein